ncbi:hypothetical protein VaNZ11_010639 [Volvox africanus]|uniref:MYND-type domain-containing protein n=1 Tax=Volvox africanus TaxID=51714 RepID=A0ABQ5SA26_9CHLO|nr:hypothetical protein VaNZ11_010639 [Volvox africanus]
MELGERRSKVDAFHARFNAKVARKASGNRVASSRPAQPLPPQSFNYDEEDEDFVCGGCGTAIQHGQSLWCGACKCTAYCNIECQRVGWKRRGHKAACKLLARAKALPPADLGRNYVVQLKLVGRQGLTDWAGHLQREGQTELCSMHREMAAVLAPRERVLFALEARSHFMLKFLVVDPSKRLEAHDLALFTLQAVLEPTADVPTLNMPREAPQRPYAIWIPGGDIADSACVDRPMARPVGQLLAGAGLTTSTWYVGGGFCAEAMLRPDVYGGGSQCRGGSLINTFVALDPDGYTEDEEDEDGDGEAKVSGSGAPHARGGGGGGAAAAFPSAAAFPPPAAFHSPLRVLMIGGLHLFGPDAGEGNDPFLTATAGALRSDVGAWVDVAMYKKGKGNQPAQRALAQRLMSGDYNACVVLGLGSGDSFRPRRPTYPWGNGPWRDVLTGWVRGGGVLVLHGERAAAAVMQEFFGLPWTMDRAFYSRTDHKLNVANPLLGDLASSLPRDYNVKACMLYDVPPWERIYATALGARTHSLPLMEGERVEPDKTALAAAQVGSGAVVFFGDVNWEPLTMATVAMLTRRLVTTCVQRAGDGGGGGVVSVAY